MSQHASRGAGARVEEGQDFPPEVEAARVYKGKARGVALRDIRLVERATDVKLEVGEVNIGCLARNGGKIVLIKCRRTSLSCTPN